MEFKDLSLHDGLFKGVTEAGYITCTPVQDETLKISFEGRDLFVQSQTGTGKTAAYLITIFQRLLTRSDLKNRKALVVVPTRELAVQVQDEAERLLKYVTGITVGAFYGGVGYRQQEDLLRNDVDVMVGTPGRLIDFNKSGKMLLNTVGFLVIDEADRMFDMGFIDDLRRIIRMLPPNGQRQTMLFSATLNIKVKTLAWDYAVNAAEIAIEPEHITVDEITHELYHVGSAEKLRLLLGVLEREKPQNALVFCNTRHDAEILAKRLKVNGVECDYIIGDLPQKQRLALIDGMKEGSIRFLIATDVAARGLDIQDLALVVNYDVPMDAENYVHRIGRTARAGKTGKAITFACERYVYGLPAIERYVGMKIPIAFADDAMYLEDRSAGMRIRFEHAREFSGERGPRFGDKRRGPIRSGQGAARSGRPERAGERRTGGGDYRRRDVREAGRGEDEAAGAKRRHGEKARVEPPIAAAASRQAKIARAAGSTAPSQAGSEKGGRREGGQGSMYHLPAEERMAYYRKKYGKEVERRTPEPAKDAAGSKAGTSHAGTAKGPGDAKNRDYRAKPGSGAGRPRNDSVPQAGSGSRTPAEAVPGRRAPPPQRGNQPAVRKEIPPTAKKPGDGEPAAKGKSGGSFIKKIAGLFKRDGR